MEKFKVTFIPDQKSAEVAKDATILSAALAAGVYINSSCGGEGVCGRCKVVVRRGKVTSHSVGHLTQDERRKGVYLACVTAVQGDIEVEVPAESRLNLEGLTQEEVAQRLKNDYSEPEEIEPVALTEPKQFARQPLAEKIFLELPRPTLNDKVSDLERLERQIVQQCNRQAAHMPLANLKSLGELLRASDWKITATLGNRGSYTEITQLEPGDTASRNYGVCFDIGTTTVSGQLVDLRTGRVLGSKATYNKQAAFGSDVITRIMYARETDGLEALHHAVIDDMNEMVRELALEHGVGLNDITAVVCAGNTTMTHLLLRVDPTYIRREPYVPTLNFVPVVRATEVELRVNPRALLACVPGVASYVGGDLTAGVLASGLYRRSDLCILIDIGTNGEIVVGNQDFLISAAASAGPAFEGSGVASGMRAARGAIQRVRIVPGDFHVRYEVIGNVKPTGICGSGYIDLIAEMLRVGILDKDGKIKPQRHPRIRENEFGREFVVAFKEETAAATDIVINEPDIDNLKRAKGAIYAATSTLVRHMGLSFQEIKTVYIAGGFGTYLDMTNAIAIGLLPDLPRERFSFIGNSSLAGAREMLLSRAALDAADEIARKTTYFELSVEPGYMDEYMAALFFPHTDLTLFPSVKR